MYYNDDEIVIPQSPYLRQRTHADRRRTKYIMMRLVIIWFSMCQCVERSVCVCGLVDGYFWWYHISYIHTIYKFRTYQFINYYEVIKERMNKLVDAFFSPFFFSGMCTCQWKIYEGICILKKRKKKKRLITISKLHQMRLNNNYIKWKLWTYFMQSDRMSSIIDE